SGPRLKNFSPEMLPNRRRRLKVLKEKLRIAPDHPQELASQALLMDALGTADLDFYRGLLAQLADADSRAGQLLEAERIKYAIRIPANQVLQHRIGYLLKRPVYVCRVRPTHYYIQGLLLSRAGDRTPSPSITSRPRRPSLWPISPPLTTARPGHSGS